jgi:hypothetical protein
MAGMEYLGAGREPPGDQEWILVRAVASGHYVVEIAAASGLARTLKDHERMADAIVDAQERATLHNIQTVYLKGVPNA